MTIDFPAKITGYTTYVCEACKKPDFIPTWCELRIPEFEGFMSTTPTECPYKMTFGPNWVKYKDEVIE